MSTSSRVRALDGVRAFAVAAVVAFHLGVADSGFIGVDVFFVLSGFLITRLVVRQHQTTGRVSLGRFYANRSLRLYPALVVVVVFCLLVAGATGTALRRTAHDALVSVLYVSNLFPLNSGLLDHTWTLSLEEQFYLLWPAVCWASLVLRRRHRRLWATPGVAIVLMVLVADRLAGGDGAIHTYVRAMGLPLGCALAFMRPGALRRLGILGYVTGPVLLLMALVSMPAWLTTGWPISGGAVLAAPVVALAASGRPRWLELAPLAWLGRRSYGLYLWHFPVLSLAEHHAPNALPDSLAKVAGVVVAVVAADLSFRYVEMPTLSWRNRHLDQGEPALAARTNSPGS